jgi:hypothetical protein
MVVVLVVKIASPNFGAVAVQIGAVLEEEWAVSFCLLSI